MTLCARFAKNARKAQVSCATTRKEKPHAPMAP